jgi:hypothetical protein
MTKVIDAIRNFAKAPKLVQILNALNLILSFGNGTLNLMARIMESSKMFLKTFHSLGSICNTFLAHKQFTVINLTSPWNKFDINDVLSLIYIMIIILII